ncbi:MAG: hypothetical protein Q9N62_13115 [Ghiorsea sp.]|nr:hypothetical protein [Ghiorsea sp.]
MNKQWIGLVAAAALIGLSGCSSDSSTTAAGAGATGAAPTGTTVSGNVFTIDGIWKSSCFPSGAAGSPDEMDTITFNGATGNVVVTTYTSTDSTCTGTATALGNFDVVVATGATEAITGWQNLATGAVALAPAAADGSGPLPTTASFTKTTATVTAATASLIASGNVAVGDIVDVSMIIDDTGLPVVGYTVNYVAGASTAYVDDFLTKQ